MLNLLFCFKIMRNAFPLTLTSYDASEKIWVECSNKNVRFLNAFETTIDHFISTKLNTMYQYVLTCFEKREKRIFFLICEWFFVWFCVFFAFCCVNFQLCPCRVLLLGYVWMCFWRWSAKNVDSCIFCRLQRGPSTTINSYVFANDS